MPRNSSRHRAWIMLGIVLVVAVFGRALLLLSDSVSFHSDEAIVGLMARHILAGDRPTFFFGQAYMGSLDAWLVALGFQLLGESVATIRIVQSLLYLLVVASAYSAAWVLSRRTIIATVTALTFAIASPLLALYTTATLGGYNETLIFGHLTVALGFTARRDGRDVLWRWGALGLIVGLGWWTNALIAVYALPVAVYLLYRLWRDKKGQRASLTPILIALLGLVIGSAPWWVYALQNDLTPIRFFLPDLFGGREVVGAVIPIVSFGTRLAGLLLFGLPAVAGMRYPWAGDYFALPVGLVVIAIFLMALVRIAREPRLPEKDRQLHPGAPALLLGIVLVMLLLFLVTRFASDPSGRYFLPLTLPFGVALGVLVASMPRRAIAITLAALPLTYFAAGQIVAASTPPGFTTQFVAQTHVPNTDDARLIEWLDEHDIEHGYTTYWQSFRLAFLSGERLQFSAALPDKSSLDYTPAFERYPPYRAATDSAERIAYLIPNVLIPELDAALVAWFDDLGLTFQSEQIGPYKIYYDFGPSLPRPPFPFIHGG
ncbi:MAG: glycosyltransferase family 39 protein [Anaerolineae bacterium]|nr:glycosyltransferase family 39 protein [Anaerolineae bacterium]